MRDASISKYQPKGGMCCSCINRHADCKKLNFSVMPPIKFCKDGAIIVRCVEFKNDN